MQIAAVHLAREPDSLVDVLREDGGTESEATVVGQADRVIDTLRAGHPHSRAEQLLTAHTHVTADVGQHSRLNHRAVAFAAAAEFCPVALRLAKPLLDALGVPFTDKRANVRLLVELVAGGELVDLGRERVEQVVVNARRGKNAL